MPESSPLILSTLNATYQHCAFGLRYLHANLKELRSQARILEFTIGQEPRDIAESILAAGPKLVGFGVYIWNVRQTLEVVSILKRVRPELAIVLGGPEVSYETEVQALCRLADLTIQGEGEDSFYAVCRDFLATGRLPEKKWLPPRLPELATLELPYDLYAEDDIKHRVIYVEASRGCPYKCEFCLSSLDTKVRPFALDRFLAEMDKLIARGARQFKFVDRTFNLSVATGSRILSFFLERLHHGLFLHFEIVPDRLPSELRELIAKFPDGTLQFEIGIQTWDPETAKRISRRQDYAKVQENFAFLVGETRAHLHADLIVGLPGEDLATFARGFDAVARLQPHEIQVGVLKRLRGTPIIRHDREWEMVYAEDPPYTVLRTKTMDFDTIGRLQRFAKFWDLYANRGNFPNTMKLLRAAAGDSLFAEFFAFSVYLDKRHPQRHSISLQNLVESAWRYLTEARGLDLGEVREALVKDYTGYVKRDIPSFLRDQAPSSAVLIARADGATPRRQARHLHS